jgi:4,5-DOPA dioxygenase extradiol
LELITIVAPHTPDLLESYRSGHSRTLLTAYQHLYQWLSSPPVPVRAILSFSPGWQTRNVLLVDDRAELESSEDYAGFGVTLRFDPPGEPDLAKNLIHILRERQVPAAAGIHGVDHATAVPLFFLNPDGNIPVLPVSQPLNQTRYVRLLGESVRRLPLRGYGRILVLLSGVWAQNEKMMAKGLGKDNLEEYRQRIVHLLTRNEPIDPLSVPMEEVSRAAPPGKIRELHFLAGAGLYGGRLWGTEEGVGHFQTLASFGPVDLVSGD